MRAEIDKTAFQYFDMPDNVVKATIDPQSGKAVPENTPGAVTALFKHGTEPGHM